MQDEQEHSALYYHCISLQKKLKLVLPDRPLPIIDPNTNYLSYKIFRMEFNLLRNIYITCLDVILFRSDSNQY